MKMIRTIFADDVRRLLSTVVTIVITVGLIMIPGLFAWFNIAASWDPFGNSRNIKVAIANNDAGYSSDNLPITVNIGDQIVGKLRANEELHWVFTRADEAIDGTKSGEYYAAVIIPKNFSATMLTFFSPGAKHPKLTYVTNQKLNAVAPKLTGKGADQIAATVNTTFSETLTSTALRLAGTISRQLDEPQSKQRLNSFNANIASLANQLDDTASTLHAYDSMLDAAGSLLKSSNQLLDATSHSAEKAKRQLKSARSSLGGIGGALNATTSTLSDALSASSSGFSAVGTTIDTTFDDAGTGADDVSAGLRRQAGTVQQQITQYEAIRDAVQSLASQVPQDSIAHAQLEKVADSVQSAIDQLTKLRDALNGAASDVDVKKNDTARQHEHIKQLAAQASSTIGKLNANVNATLKPQTSKIVANLNDAASTLDANSTALQGAVNSLQNTTTSANDDMASVKETLASMQTLLTDASKTLSSFSDKLADALSSGDMKALKQLLGQNPETLAAALAAPVQLERKAVFPIENFGAAMTPFYTIIPLWVGSLLAAMMLKTGISQRRRQALREATNREIKPHQLFLGHFGIFALISLAQSTFSCGGTLLFLRVHAAHPWLFMLCGWVSGLVFMFIVYTIIVSFGTIGKAIIVIVLVMQVSGTGGAYPLQVVPGFIQDLSPFLPAFHAIEAIRAAIAGIYDNDLFKQLGLLLIFAAAMLPVGLLLRKPLVRFNRWTERRLETTKLI
ncbi:MAG: YhgE/Pip domain-containing protein [Bifidobacterium sp.]|jgi:putative membrane protein|nr:YhgE/Pip domain-containing protein [Bifidobacterium sp.]